MSFVKVKSINILDNPFLRFWPISRSFKASLSNAQEMAVKRRSVY